MTDKPKDEKHEVIETGVNIEELGKGNNCLMPVFQKDAFIKNDKKASIEPAKSLNETITEVKETVNETKESHMIMHKGALIDIDKLLQQMSRSEKALEETELRLVELTKINNDLQSSSIKAKDKIKDLQSELKSNNRKLGDAEINASSANVSLNISQQKVSFQFYYFFIFFPENEHFYCRKNIRSIIRFYLEFMIKSVQFF